MKKYSKCYDIITGQEINCVKRDDGWIIPFDADNTDYQAYLKWLEEGNQPEAAE